MLITVVILLITFCFLLYYTKIYNSNQASHDLHQMITTKFKPGILIKVPRTASQIKKCKAKRVTFKCA